MIILINWKYNDWEYLFDVENIYKKITFTNIKL
jgi:hypothetical protein